MVVCRVSRVHYLSLSTLLTLHLRLELASQVGLLLFDLSRLVPLDFSDHVALFLRRWVLHQFNLALGGEHVGIDLKVLLPLF